MSQRSLLLAIAVILLGGAGTLALLKAHRNREITVSNYGIIATGSASHNKVTINERDRAAERRLQVELLTGTLSRHCDEFISHVQSVSLTSPRNWPQTDLFSHAWLGPQSSQILDREVIAALRSRQERANSALERVLDAQAAFRVGSASMMHLKADEQRMAHERKAKAISSFGMLQQELMQRAREYCEYAAGLK